MTTRRLRRELGAPWRGRMGLFGRFGSAISGGSVEPRELRVDDDGFAERSGERAPVACPLEADQPPAGVDAPARHSPRRYEPALEGAEAQQLRLRRLPPAAGARPGGDVLHAEGSPSP